MIAETKKIYITEDGKEFLNEKEAQGWEFNLRDVKYFEFIFAPSPVLFNKHHLFRLNIGICCLLPLPLYLFFSV
ncbi:hypothetical protein JK635_07535 [Neobacillus sp. YIM B02564]|uniref:Uncharacterized protein n=1 Tax=Neobacillus paridis TaxID=2803862 RepID=A0ABS1TP83_9BACI|nr:hypothetical protein [Neobacillus paridis]